MASRGGLVIGGSDGSDFSHREKIASHYEIRDWTLRKPIPAHVLNKGRLSKAIFGHLLLGILLLVKMVPFVLDRGLGVFILAVEEWEVPEPEKWEVFWLAGCLSTLLGLHAIRRNHQLSLQVYMYLLMYCALPLLVALNTYRGDLYTLCSGGHDVTRWQGTPVAPLWAAFVALGLQVHLSALYCCYQLNHAWKGKTRKAH